MQEKYITLFELMNDYGGKKLSEIKADKPQDKNFVYANIGLIIKEDRRKKNTKILMDLQDNNDIYDLSYDEFNKYFRLDLKKITFFDSYTYTQFAYEEVIRKFSPLLDFDLSIYFRMD